MSPDTPQPEAATKEAPAQGNAAAPKMQIPEDQKISRIPGVQLSVTLGKEVIIRIPGKEQSYRGTVVGLDPYDFVITKVRLPSALRDQLRLGGNVVVKYVHQGTIYGFRARVHNAIASPAPLLFFEYPDVIEKLDLRKTERSSCNIDSVLHTTEAEVECMVVNVSQTGCKISARARAHDALQQLKIDDALIVAMNLGGIGEQKVAVAVKNISLDKGIISLGCMFLDITKQEMATIQKYLDKISRLTG